MSTSSPLKQKRTAQNTHISCFVINLVLDVNWRVSLFTRSVPIVLPITGKKYRNKYHDQTTHSNTVKVSFEIISFCPTFSSCWKKKEKIKI